MAAAEPAPAIDDSPSSDGLVRLDDKARKSVEEVFTVRAVEIPAQRTGEFLKKLQPHLLNIPRRKNVDTIKSVVGKNYILLSRASGSLGDTDYLASLPDGDRAWLVVELAKDGLRLASAEVRLEYGHFSAEEVLRKLLPVGIDVPSSFEQAGHVCHLNLRESQLPYKKLIAEVLLDKNRKAGIATVVNKTGKIETEFRTFPMEHLAGDPSTIVRLKEHNCVFEFEYKDVYWNSRLQQEHGRLIDTLFISPPEKGAGSVGNAAAGAAVGTVPTSDRRRWAPVVADCTCGIGPFSIPIVKQAGGVVCHANDLNPASVKWLSKNSELNKLPHVVTLTEVPRFGGEDCAGPLSGGSKLVVHPPGDARVLIRTLYTQLHPVTHALFNLPATGLELLDCFRGLAYEEFSLPRPLVCCYTFCDGVLDSQGADGCVADLLRRVATVLGIAPERLTYVGAAGHGRVPLPSTKVVDMVRFAEGEAVQDVVNVAVRLVRNVAPTRNMFCVCFRVPVFSVVDAAGKAVGAVATLGGGLGEPASGGSDVPPVVKKQRLEE